MRGALIAVAVLLAAWVSVEAPAAEARRAKCAEAGSRTIVATRDARAYRHNGRTFACLYRANRRFRLGDLSSEPDLFRARTVRLAGRYVGYELAFIGRDRTAFDIRVRDLKTGRWAHRVAANSAPATDDVSTDSPGVTDLELASNGAVAWISRDPYVTPAVLEVHRADAHGHAQLAVGAGIDPRSLALSGKRIFWLQDDQPQTATLK